MARATPVAKSPRSEVEARYGGPIPDSTWDYLVEERYIEELERGLISVDRVVRQIQRINAAAPLAQSRLTRRVLAPGAGPVVAELNARMIALAEIISWRAARSWKVQGYRRRWLRDALINPDEITAWVDMIYHRHLPKSWPTEPGPAQATNVRGQFALWPHPHRSLEWLDANAANVQVWCVPRRGPLGDLSKLSEQLAKDWDWHPALATNFVLTGETPARPGVRGVSFRSRRGSDDRYGPYQFMWVRCSIDIEVTPEELAAWWRGLRTSVGIAGRRPIGQKSVRLATFALSRDESTSYREDMEDWNRQVPEEWRFTDYRNYRTAAHKAVDALNNPARGCHAW